MFKLKPFDESATVAYSKAAKNKVSIQVTSHGTSTNITASTFSKSMVDEIKAANSSVNRKLETA